MIWAAGLPLQGTIISKPLGDTLNFQWEARHIGLLAGRGALLALLLPNGSEVFLEPVVSLSPGTSQTLVRQAPVLSPFAPGLNTATLRLWETDQGVSVRLAGEEPFSVNVTVAAQGDVNVDPAVTHQVMTGWEGVAQLGQHLASFPAYQAEVVSRLANEMGINRVRLETHKQWGVETVNDNADPLVINPAGFSWAIFDSILDDVVVPLRNALAARGEALWVNLSTVAIGQDSDAFHKLPDEYAEFILAHFLHLQSAYGFVPNSVEISNEPDVFNTFNESGTLLGQCLVAAGDRLAANGFTPEFVAPSGSHMLATRNFLDGMLAVPGVLNYLTEVAYHRYGSGSTETTPALLDQLRQRAQANGLRLAMLEWIGAGVSTLVEDLTRGINSAWQRFALAFPTTNQGEVYYQVTNESSPSPTLVLPQECRLLSQYFRFVRTGAVRIDATSTFASLTPLAWINFDGKHALVVRASAGASFTIGGLTGGTYGLNYTTGSQFNANLPDQTIGAGQLVNASIPAGGVISIYQR